jgi:hypothetical protein
MAAPYDEGRDARHFKMSRGDNPYNKKSDSYRSWDNGWYDEDRDMRQSNRAKLVSVGKDHFKMTREHA